MNLRFKVILNISFVNFLFIHVAIDYNDNHIEKYGQVFKKEWFCTRLLKY
jgi:hypothetical protein